MYCINLVKNHMRIAMHYRLWTSLKGLLTSLATTKSLIICRMHYSPKNINLWMGKVPVLGRTWCGERRLKTPSWLVSLKFPFIQNSIVKVEDFIQAKWLVWIKGSLESSSFESRGLESLLELRASLVSPVIRPLSLSSFPLSLTTRALDQLKWD